MLRTRDELNFRNKRSNPRKDNPCYNINGSNKNKPLSDNQYLEYMIPHHQVAINVSKKILRHTNDPNIMYLARNARFKFSDEILLMENLLKSGIPTAVSNVDGNVEVMRNELTQFYPDQVRAKNYKCSFYNFSPNAARDQTSKGRVPGGTALRGQIIDRDNNRVMTDCEYLKFMINHFNLEIEMCSKIIRQSKNTGLVSFAYEIIKNRKYEIWRMRGYTGCNQDQCSELMRYGDKFNAVRR